MHIERLDLADPGDRLDGLYGVAQALEDPGPKMSRSHLAALVRSGWSGEPGEAWVARDEGEIAGGVVLHLPQFDNRHLALIRMLAVHPERRRRGIGRALLRHAIDRSRTAGRRVLVGIAPTDGPGAAFATASGFAPAATETRRVLDLRTLDWSRLDLLRADALRHGRDYALEQWKGPADDELLPDMARLMSGMNDAPTGDLDVEDTKWTAERYRRHEAVLSAAGLTPYTMVARHRGTGEPAGFTRLVVDSTDPRGWGLQYDTCVLARHRGRRLGMALKASNLAWFHECEPSIERIETWNAPSNAHMLAINETLGFTLLDVWHEWQLDV